MLLASLRALSFVAVFFSISMLALSSVALYSDPTGGEAPLLEELAGIAGLLAPDYRHDASTGRYTEATVRCCDTAHLPSGACAMSRAMFGRNSPKCLEYVHMMTTKLEVADDPLGAGTEPLVETRLRERAEVYVGMRPERLSDSCTGEQMTTGFTSFHRLLMCYNDPIAKGKGGLQWGLELGEEMRQACRMPLAYLGLPPLPSPSSQSLSMLPQQTENRESAWGVSDRIHAYLDRQGEGGISQLVHEMAGDVSTRRDAGCEYVPCPCEGIGACPWPAREQAPLRAACNTWPAIHPRLRVAVQVRCLQARGRRVDAELHAALRPAV